MSVRRASVLAVYAHPDDELFHGGAMLTHLARRGARVTIACATKGEAGKAHPSVQPVEDLGALRAQELRVSCERLGLEEPRFLGFRDSARKDRQRHDDPRALANVDMLEVEAAIRRVIDDIHPHIIITFDPHGGYYHPDHLAVHRAATAAFFSSGAMGDAAPARLFYSTFTIACYREHSDRMLGRGIVDGLDPEVFAVADDTAALIFDSSPYMDRKLRALAAHQSAFGVTLEMLPDPPPEQAKRLHAFEPAFRQEAFILGGTRTPIPRWPLADLFEGLSVAGLRPNTA
jgi:N-acetyl-1-D-myo-inositol-2-amino-2-deoxy-alpha-D-glucopyranoside deacetylase